MQAPARADFGSPTRSFPHAIPGANHPRAGTNDTTDLQQNIAALPSEERVFEPQAGFVVEALVRDRTIYERAEADYEGVLGRTGRPSGLVQEVGHAHGVVPVGSSGSSGAR